MLYCWDEEEKNIPEFQVITCTCLITSGCKERYFSFTDWTSEESLLTTLPSCLSLPRHTLTISITTRYQTGNHFPAIFFAAWYRWWDLIPVTFPSPPTIISTIVAVSARYVYWSCRIPSSYWDRWQVSITSTLVC